MPRRVDHVPGQQVDGAAVPERGKALGVRVDELLLRFAKGGEREVRFLRRSRRCGGRHLQAPAQPFPLRPMARVVGADAVREGLRARDRAGDGGEAGVDVRRAAVDRVEHVRGGGVVGRTGAVGPREASQGRGRRADQEAAPTSGCQGRS